jgi:hypothetical protein
LPCETKHTEHFAADDKKDFQGTSSAVEHDAEDWAKDQYERLAKKVIREKDAWVKTLRCAEPCGPPQVVGDSVPAKTTTAEPIYGTRRRHVGWRGKIHVGLGVEVDCKRG